MDARYGAFYSRYGANKGTLVKLVDCLPSRLRQLEQMQDAAEVFCGMWGPHVRRRWRLLPLLTARPRGATLCDSRCPQQSFMHNCVNAAHVSSSRAVPHVPLASALSPSRGTAAARCSM